MHETSDFLLYNILFIYQILCNLIYRRRTLYFVLCELLFVLSINLQGTYGWLTLFSDMELN